MGTPSRLIAPIVIACLSALQSSYAEAQGFKIQPVTTLASVETGLIEGKVTDELGKPLDGAVISALGGTTAFAVSDKSGKYTLKQLPPGPYLVRVHLTGFLAGRSTMVNVRSAARSASSFTMRREGAPNAPRISEAAVAAVGAAPADAPKTDDRNETELGWRLRHLKRGVLRNETTLAGVPADNDWFITDSFEFLGRAVGSSAKAATALFSDLSLGGQVNLLTTGAFDNPLQLLQLDRTSSVAFFSVGAPVGTHGDWTVRAAMNQSDLSSWMLAGSYVVKAQVPHRYQFGMSYSLQRYEGGNTAALMAVADTARNVGSVFAYDEWEISRYVSIGYGANYAHYDYLRGPSLFSPRVSATFSPSKAWRVRASAVARGQRAGRRGIHPADQRRVPAAAAHLLADLERGHPDAGAAELRSRHRARVERRGAGRARVRTARRRSNGHGVRLAPRDARRRSATTTSAPPATPRCAASASPSRMPSRRTCAARWTIRFAAADWTAVSAPGEYAVLSRWVPSAVPIERTHSRRDDDARGRDSVFGRRASWCSTS